MQPAAMAMAMMHKQQTQPQQQQPGPPPTCGSGCTQQHAHRSMGSAQQLHQPMQPMQMQQQQPLPPPPMQQQPAVPMHPHPHAMMQPQPSAVFGPHPLPQQQPQLPPMLLPHMHPPQSAQHARPASPPLPALDPSLNTFSVQMSHPRFASIHLRCENYEPLRAWLPFIQWDGSFMESYPMQTEFRVPTNRVDDCVGVLMRRGFAPAQSRLAARM